MIFLTINCHDTGTSYIDHSQFSSVKEMLSLKLIKSFKNQGLVHRLQAMYISANNPDCFGYVGLFSPLIHIPARLGPHSFFYRKLEQKLKGQFEDPPALYWIMSGKYDFVYNSAFRFSRYLDTRRHLHHFHVSDGGHTWNNWQNYSVMFIKELRKNLP
jgi:hypothetical protein